jgi:hypothetical protein
MRSGGRRALGSALLMYAAAACLPPAGGLSASDIGSTFWTNLLGLSHKLRAAFVAPEEASRLREAGVAVAEPGVYPLLQSLLPAGPKQQRLSVILLMPFSAKAGGRIDGYEIGSWPDEGRAAPRPGYEVPKGFVKVTKEASRTAVSEHFLLGDFLTHGQTDVWPKYLVLDPRLIDKLELLITELQEEKYPVRGLHVMSGFRTPEYNAQDVGPGARSAISRHMYGDAADVYPDDDGDGWIDDLNRDGHGDLADARVVASAAEAVEKHYPSLAGGIGIYPAANGHGPFVHIDARGSKARWAER